MEHVKKVEESYTESDKIIDSQIEEVLIKLGKLKNRDCTEEGFSFVSNYHNSMNTANFEAYFTDLCKKLPANSVIVLDNIPHHSRNSESYLNSEWKPQLLDWLNEKNIKVPPTTLRAELWVLAKQEREKFPFKIFEAITEQAGHVEQCLPPYHCELNPIELTWVTEKNYVTAKNKE